MTTRMSSVRALSQEEIWAEAIQHHGLCCIIARRYVGFGLDFDDLVHEGLFGVCRAVELFDRSRGVAFGTYAGRWIHQAIAAAIIKTGRLIRVPQWASVAARSVIAGRADLDSFPDCHRAKVAAALAALRVWPGGHFGEVDGDIDTLPARADRIGRDDLAHALSRLAILGREEREIFEDHIGLGTGEPRLFEEIARRRGLTKRDVSNIMLRVRRALRSEVAA